MPRRRTSISSSRMASSTPCPRSTSRRHSGGRCRRVRRSRRPAPAAPPGSRKPAAKPCSATGTRRSSRRPPCPSRSGSSQSDSAASSWRSGGRASTASRRSQAHPRAISLPRQSAIRRAARRARAPAPSSSMPASAAASPVAALIAANPHATFARIAALLYPRRRCVAGVHPSACRRAGARDRSVRARRRVAFIGRGRRGSASGPSSGPTASSRTASTIAEDVRLVGACHRLPRRGLGRALHRPARRGHRRRWIRLRAREGHVAEGAAGRQRAASAPTWRSARTPPSIAARSTTPCIDDGVKLDNQIQIGHNVRIGAHTAMAACVGISGSTSIGKRCMIGGMVGIVGHLTICDDVAITGTRHGQPFDHAARRILRRIPARRRAPGGGSSARLKRIDSLARRAARAREARGRQRGEAGRGQLNDRADLARHQRHPQAAAASLSVPARRPRARVREGREHPRAQERHLQRAVLSSGISRTGP